MPQKHTTNLKQKPVQGRSVSFINKVKSLCASYWKHGGILRRAVIILCAIAVFWTSMSYSLAQWYIHGQADKPLRYGVTFIPNYARHFGLDPKETMSAMVNDLGVRQFRLVSYWREGEPTPGNYNFEELDWQFKLAEESGSKISLAIGLRQPRWPECHMPAWAEQQPMSVWSVELKKYMQKTIERYKDSPALESYQLENEFFMKVFGICPDHTRERLVDEYNFVKSLDTEHPVIVSRSNNWIGLPLYAPRADTFAVSVYKRVWDKNITKRYFEYPLPAWFYANLAGAGKIVTGRDMILHELQAEPWLPEPGPNGKYEINDLATIEEQNKSMNADRLRDRIEYGRGTGMKEIYLWGAEWWYWRKVKANDPSLWDVARQEFKQTAEDNRKLTN